MSRGCLGSAQQHSLNCICQLDDYQGVYDEKDPGRLYRVTVLLEASCRKAVRSLGKNEIANHGKTHTELWYVRWLADGHVSAAGDARDSLHT